MLFDKLFNTLRANRDNNITSSSNTDTTNFVNSINSEETPQAIYFRNGKMYKVVPTNKENWYNARFLVSDGVRYDLESITDIKSISLPNFSHYPSENDNYGVTGSLDYVLRMKAGNFYDKNEKELCSACLWKSTELMFSNPCIGWQKKDYVRLIKWHTGLGMYDEVKKAKTYLIEKGFIFTDVELNEMNESSKKRTLKKVSTQNDSIAKKNKSASKENINYVDKELAIVKCITIDDMRSLKNMPFICNTEVKKFISKNGHPFAYMDISVENVKIVNQEIEKMNQIIKIDLRKYPNLPRSLKIEANKLVFSSKDYGYTKIICTPKTYTGKLSKFPYSLFFTTDLSTSDNTCGELIYGQSGEIEKANITIWKKQNHVFLIYKIIDGHLTLESIE